MEHRFSRLPGDPAMLIVCPNCVSSYRADPELLQQSGGAIRCAHCLRVWTVEDPQGDRVDASTIPRIKVEPQLYAEIASSPARSQHAPSAQFTPPRQDRDGASLLRVILALVAVLAIATGGIGLRKSIVHAAPALGQAYAFVGLPVDEGSVFLQDVKTAMILEGATPVLTLDGVIENGRAVSSRVPDIRIVVRDVAAQGLYTWTVAAPKRTLAPGESVAFKSRLVAPPTSGHDVQVGFADARIVVSEAMVKGPR